MNLNLNTFSYNKGVEAFKKRQYEKAVELMSKAIEENPFMDFLQAYKIRGYAYANLQNHERALGDFNMVEQYAKDDSNLYFVRAQINESLKKSEAAIKDYLACIQLDGRNVKALAKLSKLYSENQQFEKALEINDKIIDLKPTYDAYLEKARLLEEIDGKDNDIYALVFYGKAIKMNPYDFQGYQGTAHIALKSKDYKLALKNFSKCIELTGLNHFYYYRGICYKELDHTKEYIADINKSAELGSKKAKQEIEENLSTFTYGNHLLFFDTETTGVPRNWKAPVSDTQNWPRLVQIAWQLYDEQGNLIESNSAIIKPDNFVIPKEASDVHGITTEKAYVEGEDLTFILGEFENKLKEANLLIAHNMSFDEKIIGAEFYRLSKSNPLSRVKKLCTMEKTTNICKIEGPYGYKWPKLQELHYFLFNEEFEDAHNAEADIQATADCYFELKRRALI